MNWTVLQRGSWAGRVGKDWRRSPVTTQEMAQTTFYGTAERVVEFWTALGFAVAYDVIKEGNQCLCHQNGFGIDVVWTLVCHPTYMQYLHSADILAVRTHHDTVDVLQMKDQRNGSLAKHLQSCAIVEASVKVVDVNELEAAEKALLGLARRLEPVVSMVAAH